MASDVFFRLPACVCLSVCLIMLSYRVVIKLSSAYNRWLRDYAPKSVWRNVEISCHKHFVVVFRHQQTPPTATSDKCHNLPRSGSTVLITRGGLSVDSTRWTQILVKQSRFSAPSGKCHESDRRTYRRTDTAWRYRPRLHSIARQKLCHKSAVDMGQWIASARRTMQSYDAVIESPINCLKRCNSGGLCWSI